MNAIDTIFYIIILVMSVVVHEVSHGFMAEYFGDKTARYAGRLTLNPIKHLDLFGSIIIPLLLFFSTKALGHPFVFGWAKPIPYSPNNLSDKKWGEMWVASAGILSNLFIAIFFGLILRFSFHFTLPIGFAMIISSIVVVNLALAIFNLIPIAPLDGSKIIFAFFPKSWTRAIIFFEQYSFILLLVFIAFFSGSLYPILTFLYRLITGLAF